ncbi:hypothetical protein F5Y15DRAFT_392853 [Xylariaceae sp. FL0016]|nr:hypothetical protein F5Y15DRAFT_392853 [Xylariaceae sp. FL0016]
MALSTDRDFGADQDHEENQHRSPHNDSGVSVTSDSVDHNHAERACEKCRIGKRRCDKALPECGRCARLSIPCVYLFDGSPEATAANVATASPQRTRGQRPLPPLLRGQDPLAGISPHDILALLDHLDADWQAVAEEYFEIIHPWLAVVHPHSFWRTFSHLTDESTNDFPASPVQHVGAMSKENALLLAMMVLVTRPVPQGGASSMWDDTYYSVKRLLALMNCSKAPTLGWVQITILMSLYEFGHGDAFTSYRTLGDAVVAAEVLGIRPSNMSELSDGLVWESLDAEQNGTVWWCLFVLDQCLHSNWPTQHLPFLVEPPVASTPLPPSRIQSTSSSGPSRLIPTAIGIVPDLVPFQRACYTAVLLHRAHRWNRDRTQSGHLPPLGTIQHLDEEIRRVTHNLLQTTSGHWETELDCFSMCIAALFTIYLPYLPESGTSCEHPEALLDPSNTSELAQVVAALRLACQMSIDISCRLYQRLTINPRFTALAAPCAAPSCFWATVGFAGLSKIFTQDAGLLASRIKERFESLEHFSTRWGIAYSIQNQLEKFCGIRKDHYLIPADGSPAKSLPEYPALPPFEENPDVVMGELSIGQSS